MSMIIEEGLPVHVLDKAAREVAAAYDSRTKQMSDLEQQVIDYLVSLPEDEVMPTVELKQVFGLTDYHYKYLMKRLLHLDTLARETLSNTPLKFFKQHSRVFVWNPAHA